MSSAGQLSEARRGRVVAALRAAGSQGVSGEALATELNISRAAVGKHIAALREAGYVIDSTPGAGHILQSAPNLPLPWEIYPQLEAQGCILHGGFATGSTNDDAKALARQGAADKTVVLANKQMAGKGRLGRTWVSPEGGLYLSLVLRPDAFPGQVAHLSLIVGLGVLRAARKLGVEEVYLKWPNDVFLSEGKFCGTLLEMSAQADCVDFVIAGTGINVNRGQDALPGSAYLSDLVGEQSLARVAAVLLNEICALYDQWKVAGYSFLPFVAEYTEHLSLVGQDVCVRRMDGSILAEGVARGVDENGCLLVGKTAVIAGDVTLRG